LAKSLPPSLTPPETSKHETANSRIPDSHESNSPSAIAEVAVCSQAEIVFEAKNVEEPGSPHNLQEISSSGDADMDIDWNMEGTDDGLGLNRYDLSISKQDILSEAMRASNLAVGQTDEHEDHSLERPNDIPNLGKRPKPPSLPTTPRKPPPSKRSRFSADRQEVDSDEDLQMSVAAPAKKTTLLDFFSSNTVGRPSQATLQIAGPSQPPAKMNPHPDVPARNHTPLIGISESAVASRSLNKSVSDGTFVLSRKRWDNFVAKIKAVDQRVELDEKKPRTVCHLRCGKEITLDAPYEVSKFHTHLKRCTSKAAVVRF
jgi:hypothetical protein